MTEKTFATIAAAIFALVALLHLLRLVMGWSVVIDSWTVPMWVPELLRSATRHAQLNGCAVGSGGMGRSLCAPR